ncbi:hypothetical protein LEP1GSC137_1837 [Leptospira borgpetersenii str. Noumea 25]|nr:hypothetical protein LEP1GSC137_1837 [Leptospira borgpetersenii str. Noumea 25]
MKKVGHRLQNSYFQFPWKFFIRSGWNSFCSDLDGIWFSIKSDFTN